MSRTKTDRRTDMEQSTRSNAVIARSLNYDGENGRNLSR